MALCDNRQECIYCNQTKLIKCCTNFKHTSWCIPDCIQNIILLFFFVSCATMLQDIPLLYAGVCQKHKHQGSLQHDPNITSLYSCVQYVQTSGLLSVQSLFFTFLSRATRVNMSHPEQRKTSPFLVTKALCLIKSACPFMCVKPLIKSIPVPYQPITNQRK